MNYRPGKGSGRQTQTDRPRKQPLKVQERRPSFRPPPCRATETERTKPLFLEPRETAMMTPSAAKGRIMPFAVGRKHAFLHFLAAPSSGWLAVSVDRHVLTLPTHTHARAPSHFGGGDSQFEADGCRTLTSRGARMHTPACTHYTLKDDCTIQNRMHKRQSRAL